MSVRPIASGVSSRRLLPCLAFSLFLAACDSRATDPSGTLTIEETIAALKALQQVAGPAPAAAVVSPAGLVALASSQGNDETFSTACPGGGTYQLTGTNGGWSVTPDATTAPLYETREQFVKCTVVVDGRSYTFDSDPQLVTRFGLKTVSRETGQRSLNGSYTGAFVLTSEGKSLRCAVAFTSSMNVENPSVGGVTEGQLCGRDVNAAEEGITLGPVSGISR